MNVFNLPRSLSSNASSFVSRIVIVLSLALLFLMQPVYADIKAGDRLVTLSNLHPDLNKSLLYTMNYQQPGLIGVCEQIEVVKVKRKKMTFLWKGREFDIVYEKHTKKAGVSFQESLSDYFGPACDQSKLKSLSKIDRQGVKEGQAKVGMSKAGVLMAMGRPPHHANPDLDAGEWMYWLNRFKRKAIEFDSNGIVTRVRL